MEDFLRLKKMSKCADFVYEIWYKEHISTMTSEQIYCCCNPWSKSEIMMFHGRVFSSDSRSLCLLCVHILAWLYDERKDVILDANTKPAGSLMLVLSQEKKQGNGDVSPLRSWNLTLPVQIWDPTLPHMNRQNPSKQPSFARKKDIWSATLVRDFVSLAKKGDLRDFASDSVISKVTPGSAVGNAWGQWILTSFTHGCRPVPRHNGGLPVVFSNMSALADRTLSRQKMDDRSSWPLIARRVTSPAPSPCMTKEPSPQCSGPHLHLH